MPKRLTIKTPQASAVVISRLTIAHKKLVYIAWVNKARVYKWGRRSCIVYIGTTAAGAMRFTRSAIEKAGEMLTTHGIRELHCCVVTCSPRKKLKTWRKLERALLLTFREAYGEVPCCNSQGKKMQWADEREMFSEKRLRAIIESYRP